MIGILTIVGVVTIIVILITCLDKSTYDFMDKSTVYYQSLAISNGKITIDQLGLILHNGYHYSISELGEVTFKDCDVFKYTTISIVETFCDSKQVNKKCEIVQIKEDNQRIRIHNYNPNHDYILIKFPICMYKCNKKQVI